MADYFFTNCHYVHSFSRSGDPYQPVDYNDRQKKKDAPFAVPEVSKAKSRRNLCFLTGVFSNMGHSPTPDKNVTDGNIIFYKVK